MIIQIVDELHVVANKLQFVRSGSSIKGKKYTSKVRCVA
jgi:hypothetical protein